MNWRRLAGAVLIVAGALILLADYLTGSISLRDFNPLTGLHHEWVGALSIAAGSLLEVF